MSVPPTNSNSEKRRRVAKHSAFLRDTSIGRHIVVREGVAMAVQIGCVDNTCIVLLTSLVHTTYSYTLRMREDGLTLVVAFW